MSKVCIYVIDDDGGGEREGERMNVCVSGRMEGGERG